MKSKKSAVDLTDLALGILILGIVVTIGARMMIVYRDNRLDDLSQVTIHNDTTATAVNETGVNLGQSTTDIWGISVSSCTNGTGGEVISSGNYTTTLTNGNLNIACSGCDGGYNNTQWNCTHLNYNTSNPQWDLPNDAAGGLAEYGNWFDILVIVGVAGLILALIFFAFNRNTGSGDVTY